MALLIDPPHLQSHLMKESQFPNIYAADYLL